MKNIFKIIPLSLLALAFISCDESAWEKEIPSAAGSLDLSSLGIEVNNSEKVVTRSPSDISDFIVTVTDKNSEKSMGTWTFGDMPEVLVLPAGDNYEIAVESHEINIAEWDRPYYKGSKTFKIEKAKITQIGEVVASFASLKVTIRFDEKLKKVLGDDAKVIVKGSNKAELEFTPDETRSGFFAIDGSTTFAAHFYGTIGGSYTTSETAFKDIVAGQHHILTYSVKGTPEIPEQTGQVGKVDDDITLDVHYEISDDINADLNINEDPLDSSDRPGQEENPDDDPNDPGKGDDPSDPDNPQLIEFIAFESPNLILDGINRISETTAGQFGNAKIKILSKAGIKEFLVNIDSTDEEGFLAAIKDLNLVSFELTHPDPAVEESLGNLSLPFGKDVENQNEVIFDITSFIPFLVPFEGTHTFILSVTDNNDENNVLNLRFKVDNN